MNEKIKGLLKERMAAGSFSTSRGLAPVLARRCLCMEDTALSVFLSPKLDVCRFSSARKGPYAGKLREDKAQGASF